MSMLDRKLARDLRRMRGQVITIALVVACGIAVLVAAMATYRSLLASQAMFYDEAHFSAVFASAKRVPLAVAAPIATIPGIGLVETRVAEDVTVTVHGGGEPLTAHVISLPDEGQPQLNRLYLRQGDFTRPAPLTRHWSAKLSRGLINFTPGIRSALF